jgi:hypothetical protein
MGFFSTGIDEMVPPAGSATEYAVRELTALLDSISGKWRAELHRRASGLNDWRHDEKALRRADKAAIVTQWQNNPSVLWDIAVCLQGERYQIPPSWAYPYDDVTPSAQSVPPLEAFDANLFDYPTLSAAETAALRIDRLLSRRRAFDLQGAALDPVAAHDVVSTLMTAAVEIISGFEAGRIARDGNMYGAREHFVSIRDELAARDDERALLIRGAHAKLKDLADDYWSDEYARRAAATPSTSPDGTGRPSGELDSLEREGTAHQPRSVARRPVQDPPGFSPYN